METEYTNCRLAVFFWWNEGFMQQLKTLNNFVVNDNTGRLDGYERMTPHSIKLSSLNRAALE